ncbi:MAG: hypothetical protein C0596_16775 [Marinilabiliales bacterium]|nr:MAG: hypothetical protein C0596_16775 [Marinilabiliales bacterium]
MKKTLLALIILLSLSVSVFSQEFIDIDMNDIESKTTDSLSYLYYPVLLDRFMAFDSTLSQDDFKYLYYGYVFTDMYNPYGGHELEEDFYDLYYDKEYEKAIELGNKIIQEDPINTKLLFKMLVCHHQQEDAVMADNYASLYYGLLTVVYFSGDGKSVETAFKVINVADEYEILSELGLQSAGQALIGTCDKLSIDQDSQEVEKGEKKIKELYFDVSLPFQYLNKQFEM